MTWTKLGDEFADETSGLSSDAFRLHVEALIWSNKKLVDLIVPKRKLPRDATRDSVRDATRSTGTGLDGSERENKGLEEGGSRLEGDLPASWPAVIPPGSANSR